MANMSLLYQEEGLQGILPYAFGLKGQGYEFLCKKLLEGVPFYLIISKPTGIPYFDAEGDRVFFSIYSNEEQALVACDRLAKDKFMCEPVVIQPSGWADTLWKRYRDLGATHLIVDESVWVAISNLAPPATYDGMINSRVPLRNATLNAALYMLSQYSLNGMNNTGLTAYFWQIFKESRFYMPLRPTTELHPGESLNPDNSDFHFVNFDDGSRAVLLFTDGDFVNLYAQTYGLTPEEYTAAITPNFESLQAYMDANEGTKVVLNCCAGDFLFDRDVFEQFESIALNQSAKDAGN